jgi:hypothetical protein
MTPSLVRPSPVAVPDDTFSLSAVEPSLGQPGPRPMDDVKATSTASQSTDRDARQHTRDRSTVHSRARQQAPKAAAPAIEAAHAAGPPHRPSPGHPRSRPPGLFKPTQIAPSSSHHLQKPPRHHLPPHLPVGGRSRRRR